MKIEFLLVHPTHYFAFFLRNIQNAIDEKIIMEVNYLDEINAKYPWTSSFREGYTSHVCNGSFFRKHLVKKIIDGSDTVFILAGWERPDKLFLIFLLSLFRRKFLVYTDTPDTYKKRSFIKDLSRNLVLRFISANAHGILVTGDIGVQKVHEWPFKFQNVINLPFFVDLNYFKPSFESQKNVEGHLIFFSSGRLVNSHKGFDLAIKAFGKLKKAKSLTNFSYFIAGEGPDRSQIEELIEEHNVVNEVTLLGWTEPGELLRHYQHAHIFLHPSHFDPYPNAILEAMACGLAVIASNKAGSAIDRIDHGVNGYLFEAGDLNQLADNISGLAENRSLIDKFGIEARANAEKWPVESGITVIKTILKTP